MSTYTDDGCTNLILNFIAALESGGSYDAYFGHANSTTALSTFSLDGIYWFQRQMTGGSTAIGRYQFLLATLQGLQTELGLSGATIFSPAVQDRLAVALLVRRGYSAWWTGRLSDNEFAHRLALEWASLPDPENSGKSAYDGDSMGNHAGTTLAAVYTMLEQARGLMPGPPVVKPAPPPPAPSIDRQRLLEVSWGQDMYATELEHGVSRQRELEIAAGQHLYAAEIRRLIGG